MARTMRDIGRAVELAQDALVAALEHRPIDSVLDKPAASLMTIAKHRALDCLRHNKMQSQKLEEIGYDLEAREALVVRAQVSPSPALISIVLWRSA